MTEYDTSPHIDQPAIANLDQIPFREPILPDNHEVFPDESPLERYQRMEDLKSDELEDSERTDRQWGLVTSTMLQSLRDDPDLRSTAAKLHTEPLTEHLPLTAVKTLRWADARTARAVQATELLLGKRLALGQVPNGPIAPDITNAPPHYSRAQAERDLEMSLAYQSDSHDTAIHRIAYLQREKPGITTAERKLIAQRYRYARDVKLIGLAAELHDNPLETATVRDGVVSWELPSGVKLGMTEQAHTDHPDMLDPSNWESRRQLKDRVYLVRIAGQEYIQKERKTARHTDTKQQGHLDGLTSREEFTVAEEFAELGTIQQGDVSLRFEKPIGYAEFPDGYQFTMFEYDPDVKESVTPADLQNAIIDSEEAYRQEYEAIKLAAATIYTERKDLFTLSNTDASQPEGDELTYEEFANLKAQSLVDEAKELLKYTLHSQGYVNSDLDGFVIKIERDSRPRLEIIGFDFEYYQKDPKWAGEILERVAAIRRNGERLWDIASDRPIKAAARYALHAERGWALPPMHRI